MATSSPSFVKLTNSDFSAGSSFVVNKGANGSTASAVIVFNKIGGNLITSKTFKIGSVKVGGQSLFAESININAEFGAYTDSAGFVSLASLGSCSVAESEKTTSKSLTNSTAVTIASGYYPAVKITISSAVSSRGAEVVMSSFSLSLTYTANYTITTAFSGSGNVEGGGVWQEGATAKLTATPSDGWVFVRWNDNVTTNPRDVKVTGNATYTAYFEKETINNIQIGKIKPSGIYYTATTKTITFVIADAVSITASGADTVDGYHLVVSNTAPSGATPIKGVQVGTTYVYTT